MTTRHVGGGDLQTRSVGRSGSGRVSRKTGRGSRVTLQTSCKVCTKLERKEGGKFLAVVYIDSKKKKEEMFLSLDSLPSCTSPLFIGRASPGHSLVFEIVAHRWIV